MPYFDRLQTATYVSPSGQSFSFSYQEVTRSVSHRIGSFEFPGVNGTLHQDKGLSGEQYPLTIYIHGPDYDLDADAFFNALGEIGPGTLIHPRYGRKRVQVIRISQAEDLTAGAGQAVFNVTFQETLQREFPNLTDSLVDEVPADADDFQQAIIDSYADQVVTETLDQQNNTEQSMLETVALVRQAFQDFENDVENFTAELQSIEDNISIIVETPGQFAESITNAIRSTTTASGSLDSKMTAYNQLITEIDLTGTKNQKLTNELVGTQALAAMAESINSQLQNTSDIQRTDTGKFIFNIGTGFTTRSEVLAAILGLRQSFIDLTFKLGDAQTNILLSDSYLQVIQSFNPLATVTSKVINAGLVISFNLPTERVKVLNKDENLINLCNEFYKNVDDSTLDFFINTNRLNGNEILTIPAGREIVYYA